MAKTNQASQSWLISPKGFTSLLGAEYEMLKEAGGRVLHRFYISAVAIVSICIISMISIGYAVDLLFHSLWAEIGLAIFLSLLFMIIYIFLINTFTKETENASLFTFSNISRMGFVVFMAFMLSKPVEVWMMKERLDDRVEEYRNTLAAAHQKGLDRLYGKDIIVLQKRLETLQLMASAGDTAVFTREINSVSSKIAQLQQQIQTNLLLATARIEGSDFFIYRVLQVVRQPLSWLICTVMVVLFVLPGLLIYSMSKDNAYFRLKKNHERSLIAAGYDQFTRRYQQLFYDTTGKKIQFYSCFADPPFNTQRRTGPSYSEGSSFFDKYFV
jgi:hypothetical protein